MSLTDPEHNLLANSGTTASPTTRRQAVAVLLRLSESARDEAANILGHGFVAATQPSFHYIPKGDAMATEAAFDEAYRQLAERTNDFTDVSIPSLTRALTEAPETLAPLRMILGFTHNELAWALKLAQTCSMKTTSRTTDQAQGHPELRTPQRRLASPPDLISSFQRNRPR